MARAVKKENKNKSSKKGLIIGLSVGAVVAIITTIILLVIFLSDGIEKIDYKSREITLESLEKIVNKQSISGEFEQTIYVYVYSSDIQTHTNCDLDTETKVRLNTLISTERQLYDFYNVEDVHMDDRIAFYTLDIYDEDNEGILNNSQFLNKTEAGFVLKIEGESIVEVLKDNELKQTFKEINVDYFAPALDKYS